MIHGALTFIIATKSLHNTSIVATHIRNIVSCAGLSLTRVILIVCWRDAWDK